MANTTRDNKLSRQQVVLSKLTVTRPKPEIVRARVLALVNGKKQLFQAEAADADTAIAAVMEQVGGTT